MSVRKIKKKVETNKGFESLPHFTFSEDTKQVLADLFAHYPPDDGNSWEAIGENIDTSEKRKHKRDDIFSRPSMTKSEIAKKLETLASRMTTAANLRQVSPPFPFNFKDLNI